MIMLTIPTYHHKNGSGLGKAVIPNRMITGKIEIN